MPSEAAALAIFTASTSDQPRAISAHMAPVWHEPAERVCVAFVGYPSTWMTSPPGVREEWIEARLMPWRSNTRTWS